MNGTRNRHPGGSTRIVLLAAVAAVSLAACGDRGDRPAGGSSDAAQPVDEPHGGDGGDAGLRDAALQDALQGIGACEQEVFGEQAWYDRFGFMYYEFMAARYLRAD